MCVYNGDNPQWFNEALRSVVDQTCPPSEIVLVVDGPINNELSDVINDWKGRLRYETDN